MISFCRELPVIFFYSTYTSTFPPRQSADNCNPIRGLIFSLNDYQVQVLEFSSSERQREGLSSWGPTTISGQNLWAEAQMHIQTPTPTLFFFLFYFEWNLSHFLKTSFSVAVKNNEIFHLQQQTVQQKASLSFWPEFLKGIFTTLWALLQPKMACKTGSSKSKFLLQKAADKVCTKQ